MPTYVELAAWYTHGVYDFAVPDGLTSLLCEVRGAGAQGFAARIPVTPAEALQIVVGGAPTVPDDPDDDGYWTVQGGYNGGGPGRSIARPGFMLSPSFPGERNGWSVAGGGASEVRRAGERVVVSGGAGGGWTNGGTPIGTDPVGYLPMLGALPDVTDPPRVPYAPAGNQSELGSTPGSPVIQLAATPGDEVMGGWSFAFYTYTRFGETLYAFNRGGGGGYGGGASSAIFTDGVIFSGDDAVFTTNTRTGGSHITAAGELVVGLSSGLSDGSVRLVQEIPDPAPGGPWSVGHIGF